jgi:chromate transporter
MTGITVILLYFIGLHELLLLVAAGLVMMVIANRKKLIKKGTTLSSFAPFLNISAFLPAALFSSANVNVEKSVGFTRLFLIFLKIGSVLYGSGYVLLAFLEADFVDRYGLLTKQQLLDAISVGQFTPGPVFTTATFIGYLTHGFWGGILATIGIFLPAFILVGLVNPYIHKLRSSSWISGILDGVNAASWGLMAVVSWKLGISAVIDITTIILFVVTLVTIFRYKVNTAWLVFAGGMIGYLVTYLS